MPFVIVAWLTWFLCWSHWTDLFWLQNLLPMATWQSCACNCSTFCTYTYSGSPHNVMHLSSYCEPVLNLIKILWFRQQPHETLQVHFYCQISNDTCNFISHIHLSSECRPIYTCEFTEDFGIWCIESTLVHKECPNVILLVGFLSSSVYIIITPQM